MFLQPKDLSYRNETKVNPTPTNTIIATRSFSNYLINGKFSPAQ